MELSQQVRDAGHEVASATGPALAGTINSVLGRFLGWPFKATSGYAVDRHGNRSETFDSVIHTAPEVAVAADPPAIPADNVGAIIDVYESMDLERFRSAYRRIGQAKTLEKNPAPRMEGIPITTVTLGVIFALRSAFPLEDFAEELGRLNAETPSRQWPDMVVVATTGAVNYAVQFPGEQLSGDFLPPAEGALATYTPPMYIVTIMRPTADYTFNKMTAFLVAHLAIFSPGAKLPNWTKVLEGVPQHAVTLSAYQYNLRGELLPVPRQYYNDRYIAPLPVLIEDRQGNLLSTLQFLPWQDGGTILLRGKLPLEGLLMFLDREALLRAGIIKRPDAEISYVLPITRTDFDNMLARFQRQSNMVVRADPTKWVVQKFADEGSQSLFMARLLMGIMRLRDMVFPDPAERDKFDKSYEFVISSLLGVRAAAQRIVQIWEAHARRVTSGEVARIQGRTIHIDENIDEELRKEVDSFLNAAVRALKYGMQTLATELQVNIGFLFQKQVLFDKGLAALQPTDPLLAEYLRQTRTWSERLMESRNAIEHEGWMLPRVTYSQVGNGVKPSEPVILGQHVSEFAKFILDRLLCFIEEATAHCLQRLMPQGTTIMEIPLANRVVEAPERFRVTLANGGMPAWRIAFHCSSFEET